MLRKYKYTFNINDLKVYGDAVCRYDMFDRIKNRLHFPSGECNDFSQMVIVLNDLFCPFYEKIWRPETQTH